MKTLGGIFIIIIFGLSITPQGVAQQSINLQRTFTNLRTALIQGQKIALRDLGSLLDENQVIEIQLGGQSLNNRVGSIALQVLRDFTLFTPQEIEIGEQTTSLEFLDFYYKNEAQILFSELTKTFQIQAIEDTSLEYRLRKCQPSVFNNLPDALFREINSQIREDIGLSYYDQIPIYLEQISKLKTRQAQRFLLECLQGRHWGEGRNPQEAKVYRSIILGLRNYPGLETTQAILQFLQDDRRSVLINPDLISFSLSMVTNLHPAYPKSFQGDLQAFYDQFISKYTDYEVLKDLGYEESFDYSQANFEEAVDYFGKMLNDSYRLFWIKKHAVEDIIQLQHPKALMYLAAQLFQNRHKINEIWYQDLALVERIRELTQIDVEVKNAKGEWVRNPESDYTSRLNYLRYWLQHYDDYSWNDEVQVFENQVDSVLAPPDFSKLLRKLYTTAESEGLRVFEQIAQLPEVDFQTINFPPQVVRLGNRETLPSYPFYTLKVLNAWLIYCRKNQISIELNKELSTQINKLRQELSKTQRFQLENQIIANTTLEQIDALEYLAILTQNQIWYFNPSLSRIIQKSYLRRRKELFANPKYLKAYLKKSYLFGQLYIQGICKRYLENLGEISPIEKHQLELIYNQTKDKNIKYQCAIILEKPLLKPDFDVKSLEETEVKNALDFQRICNRIRNLRDIDKIKELFDLLTKNQSVEATPALISLLNQNQIVESKIYGQRVLNYTVGDYAVFLLEKIYKHSFVDEKDFYQHKSKDIFLFRKSTKEWKNHWQTQKNIYKSWEKQFFAQKIARLNTSATLSLNLINNISSSRFYNKDKHFRTILKALPKLRPLSDLKFLYLNHPLKWSDVASLMEKSNQSESLIRILSYLENASEEDIQSILSLIQKQAGRLGNYQAGKFYFELFYQTSLRNWLKIQKNIIDPLTIVPKIKTYGYNLHAGQIEYYLCKRMEFILAHIGESVSAQIKSARQLKDEDDQSEALEEILLHVDYEGLGGLLQNRLAYEQGPYPAILSGYLHRFVSEDLGIPENIGNNSGLASVQQNYRKYPERDFYLQYLTDFYPNILNTDSSLNIPRVQEVLETDLVEDFAGITTGYRYWPILAVLRVLEIDFETKLGFQPNFLHPLAFYEKEDIRPRIAVWIAFLKEKQLNLEK